MSQVFQKSGPPPASSQSISKEKEAYREWSKIHRDFPKVERFGVGNKIEQSFLDVLELTFASVYLAVDQKILMLSRTIAKLDNLKFFLQIAWESKLIAAEKYAELSKELDEVGRMLGGWRKGLLEKTKLPLMERENSKFRMTKRCRFSAFQTLSFDSRFTLTLSLRSFQFTFATKKCAVVDPWHNLPKNIL